MNHVIKLSSQLVFDTKMESDRIKQVEYLKSKHKLGEFINNIIRFALEHPEILESYGLSINSYGLNDERSKFYSDIRKNMKEMNCKIDTIYDMAFKNLTLYKAGKYIGIKDKTDAILRANFLLQIQLNELKHILGVESLYNGITDKKIESVERDTDKMLELIIESYDDILNEMKAEMTRTIPTVVGESKKELIEENIKKEEKTISKSTESKKEDQDEDELGKLNSIAQELQGSFEDTADVDDLLNFLSL